MTEPLRWGIIGTGWIAGVFSEALADAPQAAKYAVASRDRVRADAFRAAHGFARSYGTYQELLADPAVDVVYIATPHTSHLQDTLRALQAGKHVLCEKPLGVTAAECRRMVAAAEKAGVMLLEAFMYRTHPQTLAIMDLVRSGAIGDLRVIRSCFTFDLASLPPSKTQVRTDLALRGGSLYDVGGYCINFSRMVCGEEPVRMAGTWSIDKASGVDRAFAGVLGFPGGVVAHFDVGFQSAASSLCEVVGTTGRIVVAHPWWPERTNPQVTLHRTGAESQAVTSGGGWIFTLEAEHMADVIRGRVKPLIPASNAIGNARVLDAFWQMMHPSKRARASTQAPGVRAGEPRRHSRRTPAARGAITRPKRKRS